MWWTVSLTCLVRFTNFLHVQILYCCTHNIQLKNHYSRINNNRLRNEMLYFRIWFGLSNYPYQVKFINTFILHGNQFFWYLLTPVCGRFDYLIDWIVQKTEFRVKYRAGAGQLYHRTRFKIKKKDLNKWAFIWSILIVCRILILRILRHQLAKKNLNSYMFAWTWSKEVNFVWVKKGKILSMYEHGANNSVCMS